MLIKNGRIHDGKGRVYVSDLQIRESLIAQIGPDLTPEENEEVIDAAGMEILPGTRGYSSVLYMQDALAAKGITDITGIAATLKVYARQESSLELVSEAAVNYVP